MTRSFVRIAGLVALAAMTAACDTLDYFGSSDNTPPLPGRRIAILALDRGVSPDQSLADVEVLLPAPYNNAEWAQPGGSPAHAMYHLALGASPSVAWSADIGAGSDSETRLLAQPLVVGNRIYSMDSESIVSAFDAGSGKRIWKTDVEDDHEDDGFFGGGIAYDDGRIFVATGFARIFALNANDGSVIWDQPAPAPMRGGPTVQDGRVFAVTLDNQMIVLSAEDGKRLWSHVGIQEVAGLLGGASPAVSGATVVVPYSSGEILGILAENGRVVWSENLASLNRLDPLADIAQIRGLPVIDRGLVFAISHAGRMVAIDLRQGVRVWDVDLGGVQTPWVAGDFLYVLTNDAQLVCLQRKDGRIRWVQSLPRFEDVEDEEDPIRWTGPVLAGDRLIVAGSHGTALSLSPYTGAPLGFIDLPAGAAVAPVVANGSLYFLTDKARLVALR